METIERGDEEPQAVADALDDVWDAAIPAYQKDEGAALDVLEDCIQRLERIVAPKTSTDEYRRVSIKQGRFLTFNFTGKLIAKTEFETRRGDEMRFELWQTEQGAMIPVSKTARETRATEVPPGDPIDMQVAVMNHFDWELRARSMLREQLGWKFVKEIA